MNKNNIKSGKTEKGLIYRLFELVVFFIVGVPGLFIFLASSMCATDVFFEPDWTYKNLIGNIGGILIGSLMILIGLNSLRQWKYILVFLSIPTTFTLVGLIEYKMGISSGKGEGVLISLFVSFAIYRVLRRKQQRLPMPTHKRPGKKKK